MENPFRFSLVIALLTMLVHSCANDMEVIKKIIDAETEPDLVGDHVEMLYTDSARLQMRMITPLVKVYESAKEARREFPEGLQAWLYEKGELKVEITANWAKQDLATNLWDARSNVIVTNDEGMKLETEQLFWDPQKAIVYSEKYTKITRKDGTILIGDTFTSKQDFSNWELKKGKATIILEDDENKPEE